jgi:hypothetical protein
MKNQPTTSQLSLAELSLVDRHRKVSVQHAAELNSVSESTFRRNYGHLIRRIGRRRQAVELIDAITLPPK